MITAEGGATNEADARGGARRRRVHQVARVAAASGFTVVAPPSSDTCRGSIRGGIDPPLAAYGVVG